MKLDHSQNPFELYQSQPGWLAASKEIETAVKIAKHAIVTGMDPKAAWEPVRDVLTKHVDIGALDSEPLWHAAKMVCNGTDVEPDELYFI
jgi:hypothetical protein